MHGKLSIIERENAGQVIIDSRENCVSVVDNSDGHGYDFFLIGDHVDAVKDYLGGCSCVNIVISGTTIVDALISRGKVIKDMEDDVLPVEINLIIDWFESRNVDSAIMLAYGAFSEITIVIESDDIGKAKRAGLAIVGQAVRLVKNAIKVFGNKTNVGIEFLVSSQNKQFKQLMKDLSQRTEGIISMKIVEKKRAEQDEGNSCDTK